MAGYKADSSNDKTREFRDNIAQMFIDCVKEGAVRQDWHKGWGASFEAPYNYATGQKYKGINRLYLTLVLLKLQTQDNRFMTLAQCRKEGFKVFKGSKSFKIEFWFPYDFINQKGLTWKEYEELLQKQEELGINPTEDEEIKVGLKARYFSVFHASQIDGIPEFVPPSAPHDIHPDRVVQQIADGMKVPISFDGQGRAYYNPVTDSIHLPSIQTFLSDYDYAVTALHELCHSTGHPSRLNRDQTGKFGSESYAFEELVAEIGSAMMGFYLGTPGNNKDYGNHKSYVQSWVNVIKTDGRHKILFDAIKRAEKAADFMERFIITAA